jgi:hypothetical protein
MFITVPKIGTGTMFDPYRPDTTYESWTMMEETETTVTIEVPDETV